MSKKTLSLFLVLCLIIGLTSTSFAKRVDLISKNNEGRRPIEIQSSLRAQKKAEGLKDKDVIRIIVELKDNPIAEHAIRNGVKVEQLGKATIQNLSNQLLKAQENVKDNIKKENIFVDYHNSFTNVVNGFSATTTFGDAKRIEELPGVARVTIANEYDRPMPQMDTSKDMIEAIETWNYGYNGEGMVVAIIDTGIDPNHKDMKLTNAETGRILEKDLLGKELPGKFYTAKVPYGYNYMDNNDIILDLGPDASEHGMHVAGTVGANGEIKGVADRKSTRLNSSH